MLLHRTHVSTMSLSRGSSGRTGPVSTQELAHAVNTTCSRLSAGWWVYEVCLGGKVRQFHAEKDNIQMEYVLGQAGKDVEMFLGSPRAGASPALWGIYKGGTVCDVTGLPRQTEVSFLSLHNVCSEAYSPHLRFE